MKRIKESDKSLISNINTDNVFQAQELRNKESDVEATEKNSCCFTTKEK